MKKKLISFISAVAIATVSSLPSLVSANSTPRDPNCDGTYNMADVIFI